MDGLWIVALSAHAFTRPYHAGCARMASSSGYTTLAEGLLLYFSLCLQAVLPPAQERQQTGHNQHQHPDSNELVEWRGDQQGQRPEHTAKCPITQHNLALRQPQVEQPIVQVAAIPVRWRLPAPPAVD